MKRFTLEQREEHIDFYRRYTANLLEKYEELHAKYPNDAFYRSSATTYRDVLEDINKFLVQGEIE